MPSTSPPSAAKLAHRVASPARTARSRRSAGSRRTRSRRGGRRPRSVRAARRSPCQTSRARRRRAARARASRPRSSFEPGKATTRDPGRSSVSAPSSISTLSISGFASSSAHMRSTCARASTGSVVVELEVDDPADPRLGDVEARACAASSCTACPCGSRMPSFGRTSTVAFTARPRGRSRYRSNAIPVRRSNASTYRALVPSTTSSRQLRPGRRLVPARRLAEVADELLVERRLAAGPARTRRPARSATSRASAPRRRGTTVPSASTPSSNFVSATMIPRGLARARRRSGRARAPPRAPRA